jgi:hypothetical protein
MSLESGSVDKGPVGCQYSCPSLVPMPLGIEIKRSALSGSGEEIKEDALKQGVIRDEHRE